MLALVTAAELDAEPDEARLDAALAAVGVPYRWAVWDDPAEDWSAYDGVLIRTTWDYTDKIDAFRSWAHAVEAVTSLWNPAAVVTWNSHKGYLLELAAQGVAIPPTVVVPSVEGRAAFTAPDLEARIEDAGVAAHAGAGLVVKPAESVGSKGLSVWPRDPVGEGAAEGAASAVRRLARAGHDVLVQPVLPAIASAGEVSVIVVEGEVSHAVRKVPSAGDIRSQPEHGGHLEAVAPTAAHLALGERALLGAARCLGLDVGALLYARIDCVDHDGEPVLMELELIEPDLFLGYSDGAAGRLAMALRTRLDGARAARP